MEIAIITIRTLKDNYTYVVHREGSSLALVIDPSEAGPVRRMLRDMNFELGLILNTHHHHDHVGGNLELVQAYGAPVFSSERDLDRIPYAECGLRDGDGFEFDGIRIQALSIPGHTAGQMAFLLPDANAIFVGDTLFSMGCGRLFEGRIQEMWRSLQRLKSLPDEIELYFGHEYTLINASFARQVDPDNMKISERVRESEEMLKTYGICFAPTLAEEKEINPFLRPDDPSIRKAVGLEKATDLEVFARLRRMRDHHRPATWIRDHR